MLKYYCIAWLFCISPCLLKAADPFCPVTDIPAALKENAHAVIRLNDHKINIRSLTDVRESFRFTATVMDAEGADIANIRLFYSKMNTVRLVSGTLYDADGFKIKSLKQSDIKDLSAVDNASLMTDARVKIHNFYYNVYPYTIDYEFEYSSLQSLFLPVWSPLLDYGCSLQEGKLAVEVPADFNLRYKAVQYKAEPVVAKERSRILYTWQISNHPAIKKEAFSGNKSLVLPNVFLAATNFKIAGYEGEMNDWNSLGTFLYKLNENRDQLPGNAKAKVHQLTDGLGSEKEKIEVLYKYMQKNCRYISLQLGIGGWQTFDATSVVNNGYGDCKALSNYMMAMLKEVGIKSNVVNIRGGEGDYRIRDDFPSMQFNHVILCVPSNKDTTWLECTSSILPPGYLSGFTDNRPGLLIDEKGSKLVHTPVYDIKSNSRVRNIDAAIDDKGDAAINAVTLYTGLRQDDLHSRIHRFSDEKQLEYLRNTLFFTSYDVTKFSYKEIPDNIPAIRETLSLKAASYAAVTGKRLFITPNMMTKNNLHLSKTTIRKSPVYIDFSYADTDTIRITVPIGYKIETLPNKVELNTKFGKYLSQSAFDGKVLTFIRKQECYRGEYAPAEYPEIVDYYNAITIADNARVVLVKE